ncbi:hypothetical protein M8C21_031048, partial [Ambrosia artemisiifolia]
MLTAYIDLLQGLRKESGHHIEPMALSGPRIYDNKLLLYTPQRFYFLEVLQILQQASLLTHAEPLTPHYLLVEDVVVLRWFISHLEQPLEVPESNSHKVMFGRDAYIVRKMGGRVDMESTNVSGIRNEFKREGAGPGNWAFERFVVTVRVAATFE